jgi:hypothetical protein
MGKTRKHTPVKLIVGFIFQEETILRKAEAALRRNFGKIDFQSATLVFNHTDYYKKEFGNNLFRKFISFQKLINPEILAEIKIATNRIEEKLSKSGQRRINIDPGYLDLSKLVLATTKDYAHRIYLKKDIYAEVTLFFQGKRFQPWPWTYPDYRTNEYADIFHEIRNIYAQTLSCLLKRCSRRDPDQDS